MVIIFLGAPGSGKSTQAELLAENLKIPNLQMGKEVRKAAEGHSKRAKRLRILSEKGALIEDKSIRELLREIILSPRCNKGFILDGAPRKVSQADDVGEFIKEAGLSLNCVILVKVSDRECIKRLLKRKRLDDTIHTIKHRLELYHKETDPVIELYRKIGILEEINGERPVEVILQDILKRLKL